MITPPKGFVLSENTQADEVKAMREIGRYLVGMCFLARRKEIDSDPEEHKKHLQPVFRSGFVMEFENRWYWITAGHILEEIAKSQKDPDIVLENFRLLDHYGSGVIDKNPIPFNFEPAWKHFERDDCLGLDYGAVELGKLEQLLLSKNNICHLPMDRPPCGQGEEWDDFFMYGFPTDSIEIEMTPNTTEVNVHATPHPSLIHVAKFDGNPLPPTPCKRFFGKLGKNWPKGSIDGMSGGPVFGFSTQSDEYTVIAVQSGWLDQRRVTFACLLTEFCPRLIAAIKARPSR